MWTIDKSFNFEMGHRVWQQELNNPELSISTECACKHLHGHSYELKVFLKSNTLDKSSMLTDFKNLNFMKKFIDESLDHKFMIDINDPNFELITSIVPEVITDPYFKQKFINFYNLYNYVPDLTGKDRILHVKSFSVVDFCPTSENICKHLHRYASLKMSGIAEVSAVELWETKKSHCRYEV